MLLEYVPKDCNSSERKACLGHLHSVQMSLLIINNLSRFRSCHDTGVHTDSAERTPHRSRFWSDVPPRSDRTAKLSWTWFCGDNAQRITRRSTKSRQSVPCASYSICVGCLEAKLYGAFRTVPSHLQSYPLAGLVPVT
jgi:hypothetical protein